MREELVKVIRIDNQESYWNSYAKDYTILSFKLERDEYDDIGTLSLSKLSGPDPDFLALMDLLVMDLDLLHSVKEYIFNYRRKENFVVDIYKGMSGCKEATLYTSRAKISMGKQNKRASLHVSCNYKICPSDITNVWIGDLVEILIRLYPEFLDLLRDFLVDSSRKIVRSRRKATIKYLKPIKPDTKVSMDWLLNEDVFNLNEQFKIFGDPQTYSLSINNTLIKEYNMYDKIKLYKISEDDNNIYILKIGKNVYETSKGRLIKVDKKKYNLEEVKPAELFRYSFIEYEPNHVMNIKVNESTIDINFYLPKYRDEEVGLLSVWRVDQDRKLTREDCREDTELINFYSKEYYAKKLYRDMVRYSNLLK